MVDDREFIVVLVILICVFKLNRIQQSGYAGKFTAEDSDNMFRDMLRYGVVSMMIFAFIDHKSQSFYDRCFILESRLGKLVAAMTAIAVYYLFFLHIWEAKKLEPNDPIPNESDEEILRELIQTDEN